MAKKPAINQALKEARLFYERIKPELPIKKIFLYGSYAGGNPRDESDIDIGVVLDSSKTRDIFSSGLLLWQVAHEIDVRIEPFCILSDEYDSCEPASILAEIKRTSIIVV
jgi:predicted nucleotidyltransferase